MNFAGLQCSLGASPRHRSEVLRSSLRRPALRGGWCLPGMQGIVASCPVGLQPWCCSAVGGRFVREPRPSAGCGGPGGATSVGTRGAGGPDAARGVARRLAGCDLCQWIFSGWQVCAREVKPCGGGRLQGSQLLAWLAARVVGNVGRCAWCRVGPVQRVVLHDGWRVVICPSARIFSGGQVCPWSQVLLGGAGWGFPGGVPPGRSI